MSRFVISALLLIGPVQVLHLRQCGGFVNGAGKLLREFSLGLNGLGACATQYASRYMDVTVWRDGQEYRLHFERGEIVGGLESTPLPKSQQKKTGTRTRWLPCRYSVR